MLTAKNKKFYLDGKEFEIHSGAFHYFRALPEYWEDILLKIKASGLNTVETYTCWNLHEPRRGEYDFSGRLDIEKFIKTAQKVGLKVIIRTGPYICAEVDNGGLPAWILKKEYNVRLRCNKEPYLTFLRNWLKVILGKIRPYLDTNGGPVIALAVENEYGSFGDDFSYLKEVEKVYIDEKMDTFLFASDGFTMDHVSTGKSGTHLITGVDYYGQLNEERFLAVDSFDPASPHFVAEFWAGNFTDWGFDECLTIDNNGFKKAMEDFVDNHISFNIYMIFGGTNFGFLNGAQGDLTWMKNQFNPVVTSYDYDAAISEWGGYTERYFILRDLMEKYEGKELIAPPKSPKLQNIGKVDFVKSAPLFSNLHIGKKFNSVTVESMEEFDQNFGYILYKKVMDYSPELNCIKLKGIKDRAHVFVNGKFMGIRERGFDESAIILDENIKSGDVIEVLVENMGRICYGEEMLAGDRKGITDGIFLSWRQDDGEVRIPGKMMFNWEITTLELDDISKVNYNDGINDTFPAFFKGTFKAENQNSCFVHFDNLKKGVIFINGFNLGRYWERGPLKALYVPGVILKDENEIVVFETDGIKGEPCVYINDICGIENHHEEIFID